MKAIKASLLAAAALMAGILSTPALAATGTVLRNDKLYSQPSVTASVAGTAARGTNVTILAKQGGWLRVKAGTTTGWIRLLSVRAGAGGLGGAGVGDVVGAATTRSNPSRVVAVAGLRGLNDEDLKQAEFNAAEMARLEAIRLSPAQARSFAGQVGLTARPVPALPKPQRENDSSSSPWGES